ncbi:hypothetical protein [Niabella ginsengisoli]|uniref:Uncharacterized protein n=1 Tax=Niabella ginsengisoli TaxID=522298 RepID=A0ABS9SPP4_9BACT|nr:hypothetical protein [Niabella ginsengisoli]MCH5600236.1 hypothetical protein [Niabella ginsengisoli]
MALGNNGYLYYLIEVPDNGGLFSISSIEAYETPASGPTPPTTTNAVITNADINGTNNDNVFFRRMAAAPDGYIYLAATEETTGIVYLGRFLPGPNGGITGAFQSLGTVTLNGVSTLGNFNNGDIAFDGEGNLYALVNQDQVNGQAVICYAAAASISTTETGNTEMDEVFSVVNEVGDPFTGLVVGFSMASNGNFYIAVQGADGGVYLTHRDGANAIITELISNTDAANIADLATSYFPLQTVLPVTYGDIKAKIQGGSLVINWSTLTETNNTAFDIEASVNGKDFVKIGTVDTKASNGNSDKPLYYSFTKSVDSKMAIMGISILSLAFVLLLTRKNSSLLSFMLVIGLGVTAASCSKNDNQVDVGGEGKIFVRIVQIDKDGERSTSEVITAYKAD